MNFSGVTINKQQGGLFKSTMPTDNHLALVVCVKDHDLLNDNEPYKLLQFTDAETLGINASFDANHKSLVYYHISEFFRLAPQAVLYLIVNKEDTLEAALASKALKEAVYKASEVKYLGFAGYKETLKNLPVALAESWLMDFHKNYRYIDGIMLEGVGTEGVTLSNLADLSAQDSSHVSVVVAQDPKVAAQDAAYTYHGAVGSALGMIGVRYVNENLGSVNIKNKPSYAKGKPTYPLTDLAKKRWINANLSFGKSALGLSNKEQQELNQKRYIFASSFEGFGGIYFSGSTTCVNSTNDYSLIENNRIWCKAARLIRSTLLPEIRGLVKKDPQSGFIKTTTVAHWKGLVNKALDQMMASDEISGYEVHIDEKQQLDENTPLKVSAFVVSDDIVHQIHADLGLTKKI